MNIVIIENKNILLSDIDKFNFSDFSNKTKEKSLINLNNLSLYLKLLQNEIQLQNNEDFYLSINIIYNQGFIEIRMKSDKKFLHHLSKITEYNSINFNYEIFFKIELKTLVNGSVDEIFNLTYYNIFEYLDYFKTRELLSVVDKFEKLLYCDLDILKQIKIEGLSSFNYIYINHYIFNISVTNNELFIHHKPSNPNQINNSDLFNIDYCQHSNDITITVCGSKIYLKPNQFLSILNSDIEDSIVSILKLNKLNVGSIKEFIQYLSTINIINY